MAYKEKNNIRDILVVAVHPDDETLGCGGVILKHKADGDRIHWMICTNIDKGHKYYKTREKEINIVGGMYEFDSVHNLEVGTMRVDRYSMSELVGKISKVMNEVRPNIVYLPFKGDIHSDHRKIFEASYSCTKSFRYPFIEKIYMMEVLSETEFTPGAKEGSFIPNTFVDVSKYMDKKIEIMKVYESEIAEHPFPRSERNIRALATYRGATSNCDYAESFILIKEIL
jgi:N-acetylglucosamine malate deacetylase 1